MLLFFSPLYYRNSLALNAETVSPQCYQICSVTARPSPNLIKMKDFAVRYNLHTIRPDVRDLCCGVVPPESTRAKRLRPTRQERESILHPPRRHATQRLPAGCPDPNLHFNFCALKTIHFQSASSVLSRHRSGSPSAAPAPSTEELTLGSSSQNYYY